VRPCSHSDAKNKGGRSRPFLCKHARSIVVVARHHRSAQRDVAVRLFPRRPVAIDFPRRPIAVGFPRRDIAIGFAPWRAIAARTVAAALTATFGTKLAVALAASGTASRPTPVSPVGEPARHWRTSARPATRPARNTHSISSEWGRVGIAHGLLIVEVGARPRWSLAAAGTLRPSLSLTLPLSPTTLSGETIEPRAALAARSPAMFSMRTLSGLPRRTRDIAVDYRRHIRIRVLHVR
jgi:hypothetical protein